MQAGGCKDQILPPPPKLLQIKRNEIIFSNQSTKDHKSKGEASFRVLYYGGASGAVPFTWETRPGTPKHPLLEENSLPPLTPPPSYLSTPKINNKRSKQKIFDFNFLRHSKSTNEKALFSSSFVSSYSSISVPSMSKNLYACWGNSGNRWSRSFSHFSSNENKDENTPNKSPVTALCFGGSGNRGAGGNVGMFRRVKNVKQAILLIVGGSGTEFKF